MIFLLFRYLKKNHIDFALTNGYKDVASEKDSEADIDMIFKKQDFKNIEVILQNFCAHYDLKLVQVLHHDLWAKNIFLFNEETTTFLNLDIYAELSRGGIEFFIEEDIFKSLDAYENIPIVSTEKEFISYLSKKLDKGDLSEESFSHLKYLYDKDSLCSKEIFNFFPHHQALLDKAFVNDDFETVANHRKDLNKALNRLKSFRIHSFIFNQLRILKRIIYPTGMSVSFLGPDGSGKSTIIESVLNTRLPFRRKDYFHLKPIHIKHSKITVHSDPHQYPMYSKVKSYIKIMFLIFQYNKGWINNIVPLIVRSSLVIFDRYFDDLLADHKRYRYGGSLRFIAFAKLVIPKPELFFILTAEPEIIYDRKKEVKITELELQIGEYEALVDNKIFHKIDVNRTPAEITGEVITIMMNKLSERYSKYINRDNP